MAINTNPHLSNVHAVNFERAIAKSNTVDDLKRLADIHGPWLLGDDKTRLRGVYRARLIALGGTSHE